MYCQLLLPKIWIINYCTFKIIPPAISFHGHKLSIYSAPSGIAFHSPFRIIDCRLIASVQFAQLIVYKH